MSWNHRIVRKVRDNGDVYYGIHEVYYDCDGSITSRTAESYQDLNCETLEDMLWLLNALVECAKKPILEINSEDKLVEVITIQEEVTPDKLS